ncbi:HAD-IB family hydrolase [Parahaliea mediterranea]|uniref:HAD-IB family hydrolase n=1 Tax=Parahaliea mediterranea TaxID=651086 RepID=A0A939IKQ2_9GAMM|nr:HAD-IB family hydrolase [Parahaliea mediterranea]MBN7799004.1 HAD-IB family hydrolase [Parahaliea mediterranea]
MAFTEFDAHLGSIEQAPGNRPGVAFFDLDGTLIAGYSIIALAWETARHGAGRGELRQSLKVMRDLLRQRARGSGTNYHRLVRRVTRSLAGISEQSLAELGERAYHNTLARSLYREAIALVEAHRAAGHHLVIVSAASQYQIEPIARVLGIEDICCTRLEVVDGTFTGKVITPMCYGEGKSLAARRIARRHKVALDDCWFYTDSSADLPLLKEVGHPVTVNPSDRLAALARSHQWPQLDFASRGKPSLESLLRTLLTVEAVAATTVAGALGRRLGLKPFTNVNRMTQLLGDVGSGFAGLDFEVEGMDHLNNSRPAIFTFNHQSLLDSLVLAHLLRRDVVPLVKREMAGNPLVGPLLRQAGTIFVDREDKDQARVLQSALEVLQGGRSLLIAPEGTRSTLGNIQPFKAGAFFLAKKAKVPVVPIVLHNVKDALPKGGYLIRPATIRITVLPPVHPRDMGSVRQTCHAIESQYCELLGRSPVASLPFRAAS